MQFGILPLLGVLFVALKLTNAIAWSWWLVLLPFYGGALLIVAIMLIFFGLAAVAGR